MSGKQSGKGAKGDDAVDVVSIAVLESKVEIPLVDSTATLLTQSEKQTAAEMEAPRGARRRGRRRIEGSRGDGPRGA